MEVTIQILNKNHKRDSFNSGTPLLDNYLKKKASQDVKRDLSACFVLADEDHSVLGYYTLSSSSIPGDDLPGDLVKKLRIPPSYINLPVILLGRLAVDKKVQGSGYEALLLMQALEQCVDINERIGSLAIIVDPLDESAVRFYSKYGFIRLSGSDKMFLPMATARQLFP